MAMSAAQDGGMLPTNRRKPLLRTFVSLYRSEFAFQGMVDFAVIGMVCCCSCTRRPRTRCAHG